MWPFRSRDDRPLRVALLGCLEAAESISAAVLGSLQRIPSANFSSPVRPEDWAYHTRIFAAVISYNYLCRGLRRWERKASSGILFDQMAHRWGDRAVPTFGAAGGAFLHLARSGSSPAEAIAACLLAGVGQQPRFQPEVVALSGVLFASAKQFGETGDWRLGLDRSPK